METDNIKTIIRKEPQETQTYKFMDCKTCKTETRFVSTLSPKGYWICCQCRYRVSEIPFELETKAKGYEIKYLKKKGASR